MLWILFFVGMSLAALAAVVFLVVEIHRLCLLLPLRQKNKMTAWAVSVAAVLVVFMGLWLWSGGVNALLIFVHLTLFWLFAKFLCFLLQKIRKKSFRYPISAGIALLLTVGYLSIGYVQAVHVWQTDYRIKTEKCVGDLKVAMLADSHLGTTFHADGFAAYLEEIQAKEPDLVVIVGDFVDESTTKEDMLASCRALGNLHTPYGVYFVFGNHDKGLYANGARGYTGEDLVAELQKNGVTVLQDETVEIDGQFYLVGRQDVSEETRAENGRADMEHLCKDLDAEKFMLVLDHQPHDYEAQARAGVDLVLSGHTHGGQLIPMVQFMRWFHVGGNDSVYGRTRRQNTDFIVTSGISDWAIYFKTGCRSEYVMLTIQGNPVKA